MDISATIFIMFAAFVASAVRGLTGFGLAIVLVPLLNIVLEPSQSVILAIVIGCIVGFIGLRSAWPNVEKTAALTISLFGILAAPFGFFLLLRLPADLTRISIGLIAISSIFVVAMKRAALPPAGFGPAAMVGILSGLLGSFAAMAGPPAVWYYARTGFAPAKIRDAMIVVFFFGPFAVAALAAAAGRIDAFVLLTAFAALPFLILGDKFGRRMFNLVPSGAWRVLLLVLIICSTMISLVTSRTPSQ